MTRKLLIAAIVFVVAIAIVAVFLYNSIDDIVKHGIEHYGTEITGTKVSVGSVDISLKSGRGTIHDLRVANPDGFSHGAAVKLGEATLAIDIASLNRDPIVIQEIRIKAPQVSAEVNEKFETNIGAIKKHVEDYEAPSAKTSSSKQDAGYEKHFVIRQFVIEEGVIKGDATRVGSEKGEFAMPPIELTNVGGERGSRPEALGKAISAALFARISQVAADHLKQGAADKLKSKLGEIIGK